MIYREAKSFSSKLSILKDFGELFNTIKALQDYGREQSEKRNDCGYKTSGA